MDRCSHYRGCTVEFTSCLNLSNPQYITSSNPNAQKQQEEQSQQPRFKPLIGPYPAIQAPVGQQGASGFRPAPQGHGAPVHIMSNPRRERGGPHSYPNGSGRGGHSHVAHDSQRNHHNQTNGQNFAQVVGNGHAAAETDSAPHNSTRGQAFSSSSFSGSRGRGGFNPSRGRGGPRGRSRPRGGRGSAPPISS
jgi:hypothetical protein